MPMVIGVRFKNAGKLYYFSPGSLSPMPGDAVIVETARGIECAQAVMGAHERPEGDASAPLKRVLRIATAEDLLQQEQNHQKEAEAFKVCRQKIEEHRLDMKLVKVEYTFDRNKMIASFTSNGRVDFRSLVKDLASVFRTRIELKQIGVRDEAKMLGGLGICGKPLCCSQWLGDFQPVSIKMAKEQSLSLNPTKISGVCGRLMCCLKYEQDQYEKARKSMPHIGKDAQTPDGRGLVVDINVLKETVKVRVAKGSNDTEIREYAAADVQRILPPLPLRAPAKPQSAKLSIPQVNQDEPLDEEFLETPLEVTDVDTAPVDE
ncbi:MAG: stage 0 sporulation family protein [Christensenellales bacterium]